MEEYEQKWRSRFAGLPNGIGARQRLIAYLEQHEGLHADVARGARERLGADIAEMLGSGLAEEWDRAATEHVRDLRAGRFRQGDPVEFRHPETNELLDAAFEYAEGGVAHLRHKGHRVEVLAENVKAVPECCGEKEQFALTCRLASGTNDRSR